MPYKVTRSEDYLEHHGIKGQKWGVKNGPPYPLDEKEMSPEERYKNVRNIKKQALKVAKEYSDIFNKHANDRYDKAWHEWYVEREKAIEEEKKKHRPNDDWLNFQVKYEKKLDRIMDDVDEEDQKEYNKITDKLYSLYGERTMARVNDRITNKNEHINKRYGGGDEFLKEGQHSVFYRKTN